MGSWTFDLFIAELENILAAFAITRYFIFGQSGGGEEGEMLATKFAVRQSPGLQGLTLTSTPAVVSWTIESVNQVKSGLPGGCADILACCEEIPLRPKIALHFSSFSSGLSMLEQIGPLKDFDFGEDLPLITPNILPGSLLIVSGDFNPCGGHIIRPFVDEVKADVKVVKLARSAHMPILEETEDCLLALRAFLLNTLVA